MNSPTTFSVNKKHTCGLTIALGFALLELNSSGADWVGGQDSDFQNPANWRQETAMLRPVGPAAGLENQTRLYVINGGNAGLRYTAREGDTVFREQLVVGITNQGSTGDLQVTGGSLKIDQKRFAIIGQVCAGSVAVSGGSLQMLGGAKDTDTGEIIWSLYLANEPEGSGSLTITGGEVLAENGIQIGRNGGSGMLSISGSGQFRCGGPTLFGSGTNPKRIIIGHGSPVFEQVIRGEITFLPQSENSWISFHQGSRGKISLYGKGKEYFDKLVTEGRIRIGDAVVTPNQFSFVKNGSQGEYQLAAR